MRLFSHWPMAVRGLLAAGGHSLQIRPPSSRCPVRHSSGSQYAGRSPAQLLKNPVRLLLAGGALLLAGCAIVDQYSGRATVYNLQSEQAHDQGLLLNIVRASLRRPRQFTIVQKITGTATAEGSANLMFPFGPHNVLAANSGMFTAAASGGPEFEVAPLETNEFFAGILQPISAQLLDLYVHGEFPHDLLFNLFFEKIVMRRTDGWCAFSHLTECEIVFQNYPGTDIQLELFQSMVGYLVNLGLSTEKIEAPQKKDPPKSKKKKGGDSDDSDDDSSDDSAAKPGPYAYCFAPREMFYARQVRRDTVCGNQAAGALTSGTPRLGRRARFAEVRIAPEFAAKLVNIVAAHRSSAGTPPYNDQSHVFEHIGEFSGKGVSLLIYTRSTEGLIYYVGEVVRRQLHPDLEKNPRTVMTRNGPPFNLIDETPCPIGEPRPEPCKPLFVLRENAPSFSNGFSVVYEGIRYSIPEDAEAGSSYDTAAGGSYTVLTVLRQLLILNTNAKALPSTNVLTTR
jgi:hypothetical protein